MKPIISISGSRHEEINMAVAQYVAGWTQLAKSELMHELYCVYGFPPNPSNVLKKESVPNYTTDTNAVLPLLELYEDVYINKAIIYNEWEITLGDNQQFWSINKSFPLAACFVLLKANGIEVIP